MCSEKREDCHNEREFDVPNPFATAVAESVGLSICCKLPYISAVLVAKLAIWVEW